MSGGTYHAVTPQIGDPDLVPVAPEGPAEGVHYAEPDAPTAGGKSFFSEHRLAIVISVVVLLILILILFVFLTRKGGDKKKPEEEADSAGQPPPGGPPPAGPPPGGPPQGAPPVPNGFDMDEFRRLRAARQREQAGGPPMAGGPGPQGMSQGPQQGPPQGMPQGPQGPQQGPPQGPQGMPQGQWPPNMPQGMPGGQWPPNTTAEGPQRPAFGAAPAPTSVQAPAQPSGAHLEGGPSPHTPVVGGAVDGGVAPNADSNLEGPGDTDMDMLIHSLEDEVRASEEEDEGHEE